MDVWYQIDTRLGIAHGSLVAGLVPRLKPESQNGTKLGSKLGTMLGTKFGTWLGEKLGILVSTEDGTELGTELAARHGTKPRACGKKAGSATARPACSPMVGRVGGCWAGLVQIA